MDTYYIRHTDALDIDNATRQRLWDERRIAIHFPHDKDGELPKRDNSSLDLADYSNRGQKQMRALTELAKNGGYVCAEYSKHAECILGRIRPGSIIELIRGKWGSRNDCEGRDAILKSLLLEEVKLVSPCDSAAMLIGRPRQGTIMRWKRAGKTIENAVAGKRATTPSLALLLPGQQEIMCSEFLRSTNAGNLGLPKMAHLLLPVGRTMRDIDICGITDSGGMVFAQVTYDRFENCHTKLDALHQYRDADRNALVFFCDCETSMYKDGIKIVPLQTVYDAFAATPAGKFWIKRTTRTL